MCYFWSLFILSTLFKKKVHKKSRKKYIEEFVWGASIFWLRSLLSVIFCCFLRLLPPLPKWRTSWMTPVKIRNIAMGGILCDDITSEQSKMWESFNTSWSASLRTGLCFSFCCFVYDLILIKKSLTSNCYLFLQKFLLKTKIYKLAVGNCRSSIYC